MAPDTLLPTEQCVAWAELWRTVRPYCLVVCVAGCCHGWTLVGLIDLSHALCGVVCCGWSFLTRGTVPCVVDDEDGSWAGFDR